MTSGYLSIGSHIVLALYLNGQNANYTPIINGLAEALNDGVNPSWDNNVYASYGGITRSTTKGTAGGQIVPPSLTNVNGTIEYNTLEETYGDVSYGTIEPNL